MRRVVTHSSRKRRHVFNRACKKSPVCLSSLSKPKVWTNFREILEDDESHEGTRWRIQTVRLSACLSVGHTDETLEMPFGVWTRWAQETT